jgi:hypothetical protein
LGKYAEGGQFDWLRRAWSWDVAWVMVVVALVVGGMACTCMR